MKVGVLTFHRASNFGTALQACATVEALKNIGVDAELMDYRPAYLEHTMVPRTFRKARNPKAILSIALHRVLYGHQQEEKILRFRQFLQEVPTSEAVCTTPAEVAELAQRYDIILSGSDQLWNERITGEDLTYLFPFPHRKKISYASSFGVSSLSEERKAVIAPLLADFDHLAMREETARKLVSELIEGKELHRVVDPTLLLTKEQWQKFEQPNLKLPKGGYILTYFMIETPILREIANRLQKQTGLPVVNIKPSKRQALLHLGTNMMWAGPRELLSCYRGASYVITNSFHGTAFSINYEVPMYIAPLPVCMVGEVNSRLVEILEWYGLSDRWIPTEEAAHAVTAGALPADLPQMKKQRTEESLAILKAML